MSRHFASAFYRNRRVHLLPRLDTSIRYRDGGALIRSVGNLASAPDLHHNVTRETENEPTQAFPLTGFYRLLLENPQPTSEHPAYYPSLVFNPPPVSSVAVEQRPEDRARLVFGSRLVGPSRRDRLEKSQMVAGVRVPPKPEEPDNCCMSGCVNCVWDTFREELEEWAAAKAKAHDALRLQATLDTGAGKLTADESKYRKRKKFESVESLDDNGDGMGVSTGDMWEGLDDIPVGIRVFMETEKTIKSKHTD